MMIITLGDPFSVNVEIIAKSLSELRPAKGPIILVGDFEHWQDQLKRLQLVSPMFNQIDSFAAAKEPGHYFIDIEKDFAFKPAEDLSPLERGSIAIKALERLKELPKNGGPYAVVTGSIDKSACQTAGFDFPGQTEYFENLWQAPAIMTLAGPKLRVALATNHVPLAKVPSLITEDLILRKLALLTKTLREQFAIAKPKIAVCGLNPHAGDKGLFGTEDQQHIAKGIKGFNEVMRFKIAHGPLPADTCFYYAHAGKYDAVLAMYHDQGLAPLKLAHFDEAINVSGGLPHLRVSPDHGPASDLFMQGRASARSMQQAFSHALLYLQRKQVKGA